MCEERVMVHFDEANLDLHAYVSKQPNKSAFIRECIRSRMEKEKGIKEAVIEALKEFLGDGKINLMNTGEFTQAKVEDKGIKEVADFFDEY